MTTENGELSEAAIAELKSRYPGVDLESVKAPDGTRWVLRAPDKASWQAFIADALNDKKDKTVSFDALATRCVVHPDRGAVQAALSKYPAFSSVLTKQLGDMAGQADDLDAKKL